MQWREKEGGRRELMGRNVVKIGRWLEGRHNEENKYKKVGKGATRREERSSETMEGCKGEAVTMYESLRRKLDPMKVTRNVT